MLVYHRTTPAAAEVIRRDGFADASGAYGTDREHTGVWLSSVPLDENEGACGDALLTIEIVFEDVDSLKRFEWVDPDHRAGYREWLIPAKWVNIRAVVVAVEIREPSPASEWRC